MAYHALHRPVAAAVVTVAGAALLVLPWASAQAAAPDTRAAAGTKAMFISNFAFSSPALTVAVGDTVAWTNLDKAPHDVTSDLAPTEFESPTLKTGDSWSYTFTTPGKYTYYCSIHPQMVAAITAVGAGTATPPQPAKDTAPAPDTANAKGTKAAAVGTTASAVATKPAKDAKTDPTPSPTPAATAGPKPAKKATTLAGPAAVPVGIEAATPTPAAPLTDAPATAAVASPALRSENSDLSTALEVGLGGVALVGMATVGYGLGNARRRAGTP